MTRFFFLLGLVLLIQTIGFSKNTPSDALAPLTLSIVSVQNIDCIHSSGKIVVVASGGTPAYSYTWDTGATGPILSGITTGDYEVEVTDSEGSMATLKITIIADLDTPIADAGSPVTVLCNNSVTTLSGGGSAGPGIEYKWVASNGGHILSDAQTLSPMTDLAGTFVLTVTNTLNGCTATDATTVTGLHIAPSAQATGGVLTCSAGTIALSAVFTQPSTDFDWKGPGGFFSKAKNPVVGSTGNYIFTLTDTLTGCIQKSTAIVTSNLTPPNAQASGAGTITCEQATITLSGSSSTPGASFSWTGPNGYGSSDQNPVVNSAGTYVLIVQNPINGCTASSPVTVAINLTAPLALTSVFGMLTCNSPSIQVVGSSNTPLVSYQWTGPNNFSSIHPSPAVSNPGIYILTVKNPANGCTGSATATVTQNITPPNVSASGETKTCSAPLVTITGNSSTPGATYNWTGPNNFSSSLKSPSVSAVGAYTLKVTDPVNGCTAITTATVSQNTTPPSVWATSATITCTNPLAKITTTSSPQGLGYSWAGPNNFSSTAQNPLVSVAGYYYVTATNPANGCTNTSSVYVYENTTPPFAYAGEDKSLNCYFNSILINASFSSNGPAYTYAWTTFDGNIVSGANTLYPRVDLEGTYTLKITNNQNGCIDLDSMEVMLSQPVTAVISQTTPSYCMGSSSGTAKVSAAGGSQSYNYKWSNGSLTATATGLAAGMYTVTVTDTEGCSATASTTITQLTLSANVNVTHQTIPGVNNGTASVSGIGGTAPYTAKWSNGAMTLSISNLAPGPYTVTLTDSKGCTIVKTTNINAANCNLTGTISGVNVSCSGSTNGSATLNLNAATNPVNYIWSNGATTKALNGIASGTYTVTATDAANCQVVQMIQITSPLPLSTLVVALTPVLCPESADGSITAGVSGGTQPYIYNWSNNGTTATIGNLAPGGYSLTVTDAHSCTSTVSAQINGPTPLVITVTNKTDVACPSSNIGAVGVSVTGGLPPYHYFWSNGSTLASLTGLTSGNYTLTVTDGNDCPKSISTQILAIDQTPPVLHLVNASVDLDINGSVFVSASLFDDGSTDNCGIVSWTITPNSFNCSQTGENLVTLTASDLNGNTSSATAIVTVKDNFVPTMVCPSNISTGACNAIVQFNLPQIVDNCPFNPAAMVQVGGLPSGSTFPLGVTQQSFRYSDASGNSGQCSFEITIEANPDFSASTTPATCASACDGQIKLTQISGGSVSILWNNGQTGPTLSGVCPGTYIATIKDAYNCLQTLTVLVNILDNQAPTLDCPDNISRGNCNSSVSFALPMITDNCSINLANLQLTTGLPSGAIFPIGTTTQTFSYDDGSGNIGQCSFTITIIGSPSIQTVIQSPSCNNSCNGLATLNLSGGNPPFTIQWSNGQIGPQASNLCAGNYYYSVSDNNGCIKSGGLSINQPSAILITVVQVLNDPGNIGAGSIHINLTGGAAPYSILWTRNGQPFATTQNLNALFQGQYIGTITDANGCISSTAVITITNAVGTHSPVWNQTLGIYPNPATETLILDFGTPLEQAVALKIMNINGKVTKMLHFEKSIEQAILDVSDLPNGLYFLQLTLQTGYTVTEKMVISR